MQLPPCAYSTLPAVAVVAAAGDPEGRKKYHSGRNADTTKSALLLLLGEPEAPQLLRLPPMPLQLLRQWLPPLLWFQHQRSGSD